MLHYEFPVIEHISDVLPFVEGHKNFVVVDKGDYTVINYVVQTDDTFAGPDDQTKIMRRECRGLMFGPDGKLVRRAFHKFFNVGEPTLPASAVNLDQSGRFLEKLDGSMVTPVLIDGHVRWCTRMGITHVAMEAEAWVQQHLEYVDLANACLDAGLTPIFEWCSRKNRIVLDYPEDRLVLLAFRDMTSGKYLSHGPLVDIAESFGIEPVNTVMASDSRGVEEVIETISEWEGTEGVVLAFEDGHRAKIKTSWYRALHRTKDAMRQERHLVELIMFGGVDDLLPVLSDEDRARVEEYIYSFHVSLEAYAQTIGHTLQCWKHHTNGDRKKFAIESAGSGLDPLMRTFLFQFWDAQIDSLHDAVAILRRHIEKCYPYDKSTGKRGSTNRAFDMKVKPLIKDLTWSDWLGGE